MKRISLFASVNKSYALNLKKLNEVTPSLGKLGKAVEQQLYFDRGHSQGADASTRQHFVQCVNPANE